jgi:cell division transport system permease protein
MQSFKRIIKAGFSSFIRNGWLSFASITIMVLTLITLSTFLIINMVLNTGIEAVQDKIDISVYLKDGIEQSKVIDMQNELADMGEIRSIKYISKQEALDNYREQNKDNPKLLESLSDSENPLPASLEIKTYNPETLEQTTKIFDKADYQEIIYKVSYKENKTIIDKLMKATQFTKQAGLIAISAFTFVSFIIIYNTIRMAIFARNEEIEIMKLVGATHGFIKGPFLVEGVLYGLISTLISTCILSSVFYFLTPIITRYFGVVSSDASGFLRENLLLIVLLQFTVSVFIGVTSSYFAVRKHLAPKK